MARQPRLVLAQHAHALLLLGLPGQALFAGLEDRQAFTQVLTSAAAQQGCQLHAYALLDEEVRLLATPQEAPQLARWMQALGRAYVSPQLRRFVAGQDRTATAGTQGPLWSGRFRSAVLEPGPTVIDALRWVDGCASPATGWTSAPHRLGGPAWPGGLQDPPEFWALGNTPFEREAAYGALLQMALSPERAAELRKAVLGGWPAGGQAFKARLALQVGRPMQPRQPGRPRKGAASAP